MRRILDASAQKAWMPFIRDAVGTRKHHPHRRLAWVRSCGCCGLYDHEVTYLKGKKQTASELMPRVHRVASLLKRWLLGTHQGAVSHSEHLDFITWTSSPSGSTRRRSTNRGKLFYRLVQQAVAIDPVPYKNIVIPAAQPPALLKSNHNL